MKALGCQWYTKYGWRSEIIDFWPKLKENLLLETLNLTRICTESTKTWRVETCKRRSLNMKTIPWKMTKFPQTQPPVLRDRSWFRRNPWFDYREHWETRWGILLIELVSKDNDGWWRWWVENRNKTIFSWSEKWLRMSFWLLKVQLPKAWTSLSI